MWNRLVLDECHDAVLLGGHAMARFLSIPTNKVRFCVCLCMCVCVVAHARDTPTRSHAHVQVWCVSGTPFPKGDTSVYGIHQLLNINIKFVLVNSPFAQNKKLSPRSASMLVFLWLVFTIVGVMFQRVTPVHRPTHALAPIHARTVHSHPFQQLKHSIYLRNTPESVGSEVNGDRLVETATRCVFATVNSSIISTVNSPYSSLIFGFFKCSRGPLPPGSCTSTNWPFRPLKGPSTTRLHGGRGWATGS